MTPINIVGQSFGRLKVISYIEESRGTGHARWLCLCLCGNKIVARASHLKAGSITSCRCRSKEISSAWLKNYARSERHRGINNPQWKGDQAGYASIHTWLIRHYNKEQCIDCGSRKNLDWSLQRGQKHNHDIKKYRVRCRGCHIRYDKKND